MIHLDHIHPLTDFKRNTAEFRERLRKSGLPAVLTVEGRPELVVQDAAAYQRMLDLLERAETIEGIHRGLEAMAHGKGRPIEAFDTEMRRKHKIPRRKP
jgi:hypothetical protein